MSTPTRVLVAGLLVLLGGTAVLLFGGGQVGSCLGPLGVTEVQCAQATGVVPAVGMGLPVLALTIAAAALVLVPVPVDRRRPLAVGAFVGGVVGAAAFLVARPRTMEGFDSSGDWISIPRPLDPDALATAVVVGALLGATLLRRLRTAGRGKAAGASGSA